MANLIVTTEAQLNSLQLLIAQMLSPSYMHLLGSALSVSPATTLAECLAAEATFGGYAPAAMSAWSSPVTDSSGAAASTSSSGTFNNSSGSSYPVYGSFLTDYAAGLVWGVEAFGSAIMVPAGLAFVNTFTYTLISRY